MINVSFSVGIWTSNVLVSFTLHPRKCVVHIHISFQLGSIYEVLFERDSGIPFNNLANQLGTYSKLRKAPIFFVMNWVSSCFDPLFPFSWGPRWIDPQNPKPRFLPWSTVGVNSPWPFMSASTAATSLFFYWQNIARKRWRKRVCKIH